MTVLCSLPYYTKKTIDISPFANWRLFKKGAAMSNIPKDPVMLLSYINTKLRDDYPSLDSLCEDLGLKQQALTEQLAVIGYTYDTDLNRFL